MHSKDICKSGDRYGRLTIVSRNFEYEDLKVKNGQQRRPWYNCKCDCGNVCVVNGYNLTREITRSCGCMKWESKPQKLAGNDDLTGRVFGSLVVLGRDGHAKFGGGVHTKWMCRCERCGEVKSIRGSDLRLTHKVDCGCGMAERISDKRTEDLTGQIFGYLKVVRRDMSVGYKCGQHAKWICECGLCGKTESVDSNSLKSWKIMCGDCCGNSIGEKVISNLLVDNGITFEHDKTYLGCKNDKTGRGLRFDFIVNHNPVYIIEYDGSHHFKSAGKWDEHGDLDERKRKDAIKNHWCNANNIQLIRIPYTALPNLTIEDLQVETSKYLINNNGNLKES